MKYIIKLLIIGLFSCMKLSAQPSGRNNPGGHINIPVIIVDTTNVKKNLPSLFKESNPIGLRGGYVLATSISVPKTTGEVTKQDKHSFSDGILYRSVVRKYTWLEGLGEPISQEVANHLPYYFRLSMKNDAGHYQLVEAMHGDTLTSSHPLSAYILDKNRDLSRRNQEWIEKLLTVGQWVFYSDPSGENVLEERAYEAKAKDAKLVYSMRPVRNDSCHVTITYTDSYGYPADMNENSRYTYGSVAYITYDQNGFDAVIDFLDGEGYRKPNTNDVDQTRYIYDKDGRILQATSSNCVGDYVIDNWGNCGAQYIYNDDTNTVTQIYVDEKLQPMRMPSRRKEIGKEDTYIRCDVKKDKWGRNVEKIFLTANGEKDATLSGIHRITYTYKNNGVLSKTTYYDIDGKVITLN